MDVTPVVPSGRQVIERYGPAGFRISGVDHPGPVIVFPSETVPWPVLRFDALEPDSFALLQPARGVEVLLLGCGARMLLLPTALRQHLKAAGMTVDPMDTGAACRTYNVLMGEDRRVAAALFPTG